MWTTDILGLSLQGLHERAKRRLVFKNTGEERLALGRPQFARRKFADPSDLFGRKRRSRMAGDFGTEAFEELGKEGDLVVHGTMEG